MQLLQPLACGVKGAENGSVLVYSRGTTEDADCFANFSGSITLHDISLDDYGSAIVYVDSVVDVVVLSSSGSTVRSFTAGSTAGAVETISESFTGTDYTTGIADENKPIQLDSVLNKWEPSAGNTNFNVTVSSVSMSIANAIAGLYGINVDVTASKYGAEGSGLVDDYGSISKAISDVSLAGGGVVFFPEGRYNVSSSIVLPVGVSLVGCGGDKSVVVVTADKPALISFGNSSGQKIKSLGFESSVSNVGPLVDNLSLRCFYEECRFNGENVTGNILYFGIEGTRAVVERCDFLLGTGTDSAVYSFVGVNTANPNRIDVCECRFITSTSYTGSVIGIACVHLESCTFDSTPAESGTITWFTSAGIIYGTADCCELLKNFDVDPVSVTVFNSGSLNQPEEFFFEDCLMASAFTSFSMYSLNGNGIDYYCRMKSIENRHAALTVDTTVGGAGNTHYIVPDASQYGIFSVRNIDSTAGATASKICLGASSQTAFNATAPNGARRIFIYGMQSAESFATGDADGNTFRNSATPLFKIINGSYFPMKHIFARAYASSVSPIGMCYRWRCVTHGSGEPTVDTAYPESYT